MKNLVLAAFAAVAALGTSTQSARAQTACPAAPAPVIVPASTITANTTWTRNNIYLLNGFVYVDGGATLTIEAGTIVKGDQANKGTLIIKPGARLNAAGTAAQPIVFTSNQPAGQRQPGDWGGIILVGNAPTNRTAATNVEGGVAATYGGPNANQPNDNSGILQYIRIEFGGVPFITNSEINGLTMCGVGAGTTIDHIQVSASGDDAFEWFGGNVNAKYLIALGMTDDDFDTDFGFSGRVQFGLSLRNPNRADTGPGGESNGFESDNDGTGTAATPLTSAVFSNVTVLLPTTPTPAAPFNTSSSALIRRNSTQSIFNTVLAGRPYGLTLNSNSANLTTNNAQSGLLSFENNVLAPLPTFGRRAARVTTNSGTTPGFSINAFASGAGNDTTRTYAGLGLNADNLNFDGNCSINAACVPSFALPAGSLLTTGASFANAKLGGAGNGGPNGTFGVVSFRGAFGPAGTPEGTWADGWSNFNPQVTCYNRPGQTLANRDVVNKNLEGLAVAPNPSAGAALLQFDLKTATTATVTVVDALGRQVAVLLAGGKLGAGPHALALPAALANGVYLAKVTTADATQSVRFVVSK